MIFYSFIGSRISRFKETGCLYSKRMSNMWPAEAKDKSHLVYKFVIFDCVHFGYTRDNSRRRSTQRRAGFWYVIIVIVSLAPPIVSVAKSVVSRQCAYQPSRATLRLSPTKCDITTQHPRSPPMSINPKIGSSLASMLVMMTRLSRGDDDRRRTIR